MAKNNKVSFAVSVTPKILLDLDDGINPEMEVINENVRRSLGGSGEILATGGDTTITGGWVNGVNTPITSNGGTVPAHDGNTDLIFVKNTGFLFGTTTAAVAADTVLVKHDTDVIGTLKPGEAMVLPKPTGAVLTIASGSAHVDVECLVVST